MMSAEDSAQIIRPECLHSSPAQSAKLETVNLPHSQGEEAEMMRDTSFTKKPLSALHQHIHLSGLRREKNGNKKQRMH